MMTFGRVGYADPDAAFVEACPVCGIALDYDRQKRAGSLTAIHGQGPASWEYVFAHPYKEGLPRQQQADLRAFLTNVVHDGKEAYAHQRAEIDAHAEYQRAKIELLRVIAVLGRLDREAGIVSALETPELAILKERLYQRNLWDDSPDRNLTEWVALITRYLGHFADAVVGEPEPHPYAVKATMARDLVKVAALCIAAIDDLRRRDGR